MPFGGGYADALPAVKRMYNIYHPYDPVAYRSYFWAWLAFLQYAHVDCQALIIEGHARMSDNFLRLAGRLYFV